MTDLEDLVRRAADLVPADVVNEAGVGVDEVYDLIDRHGEYGVAWDLLVDFEGAFETAVYWDLLVEAGELMRLDVTWCRCRRDELRQAAPSTYTRGALPY